jgi:hypothetical protein
MTVWLETLWNILHDENCKDLIHWNEAGDGFVITSIRTYTYKFAIILYPHHFIL